jgi:hypothetical protein
LSYVFGVLASLVRLAAAGALVWICWQDRPAQLAREAFDALPAYDAAAEASTLFQQNRLTEAMLLVDEALARNPADNRLLVMQQGLAIERKNWMRQIAAGGRGALTGRGTDTASLTGAVVADLFVFGDVRDLVIESGHWLRGEATDELLVALSAGGILLTVSPQLDLGAALLKLARRMGALSDDFAHAVAVVAKRAVRERKADAVAEITQDVATLAGRAKPAGAVSIIKHVDDPATLRAVTQFSETPEGLRALLLDPATTVRWLKSGWPRAGEWLLKAAEKGRPGLDYLAHNSSVMFRMHPLLGLVKGLYKGNVPDLLLQLVQQYASMILGFALGWAAFESALLLARLFGLGPGRGAVRPVPPEPAPAG